MEPKFDKSFIDEAVQEVVKDIKQNYISKELFQSEINKLKSQLNEWIQKIENSDHSESYKIGACFAYEDVLEYLEFHYPS